MAEVADFAARVAGDAARVRSDAERIELIAALETLKSAAAAGQARLSVAFARSQKAEQIARGVPAAKAGVGVAAQVGLARRESPNKATRLLGLARCLVEELPHTLTRLSRGETTEWRATLIAKETALLSRESRAKVDEELSGPGGRIASLGDAGTARAAREIGYRLEPGLAWKRAKKAELGRRVTVRPAPDCMAIVTAHLPVAQGVAVYAALSSAADLSSLGGDMRGRGQIMADALVARILGQNPAGQTREGTSEGSSTWSNAEASFRHTESATGDPTGGSTGAGVRPGMPVVPVQIQLVMTDRTLFAGGSDPAYVSGFGPIPAPLARHLARGTPDQQPGRDRHAGPPAQARPDRRPGPPAQAMPDGRPGPTAQSGQASDAEVWVRRLYVDPGSGELVAMESRARHFPPRLREFLITRDQFCRTPWCEAPIRQIDHVTPAANGGPTSASNGQGLCQACNLAKEAPGWSGTVLVSGAAVEPGAADVESGTACGTGTSVSTVRTTTPTGHRYHSRAPRLIA